MGKKKLIKEILEEFDFERVKVVMDFLNWQWERDGERCIPSVNQLKEEVRRLCESAYRGAMEYRNNGRPTYTGPYTVGCGGFEVRAYLKDDGKVDGLVVNFTLEEWSTFK